MTTTYVALDLETTGLDTEGDAVIEIGAVRFQGDGVLDRFHTLVDPRRPVPERIQTLTGIREEEVRGAPPLEVVASDLERFLEGAILVGHSIVSFDVRFLERAGIRHSGALYDTRELAILLMPGLPEYGLAALAELFGIPFPVQHRALADAEASRELFLALRRRALELPRDILAQIAQWLAPTAWPWRGFFQEVWEATSHHPRTPFTPPRPAALTPLAGDGRPREVLPETALAVLASGRSRPDLLPAFEERAEQQRMVRSVCEAFNRGEHLLVEAGTGTGKSLAYLIPAACHALESNLRVVISTATIGLQEQLMGKEIPTVRALLASNGEPLRACQLKGRANYLCLRRFAALRSSPRLDDEEARIASRILIWLTQTETGDRAELRLSQAEEHLWRRLSAEGAECTPDSSPFVLEGTCFLQRARRRAEASHLVVVNHALLLSDAALGGHVLPSFDYLVVDEAHHLEEEATRQFGFRAGEGDLADLLDRCESLASAVQEALRGASGPLGSGGDLGLAVQDLRRAVQRARPRLREFSRCLLAFLRQHAPDPIDQDLRLLVDRGMRVQPDWSGVEIVWENLRLALEEAMACLGRLHAALGDAGSMGLVNCEMLAADAAALLQQGHGVVEGLSAALGVDDPQHIVWVELDKGNGTVQVASAPLHVGDILKERLYADRISVVMTGATLASQGSFQYLKDRLGLEEAREELLGSPFDYRRAALILLPRDIPEPTWPDYLEALSRALIELIRSSCGRALVLFTSRASLRAVHAQIREPLRLEGIEVLGQGIDGSPRHLVRALQANPQTAILGTSSFWEGVDLAGEALSLLVMARLPFTVPTEPVFAARSALYEDPFTQYALPQAVLRFKQGFGRLIRRATDRGVMVVLDRRIASKGYGSAFIGSLPPCPVREVMLREMPALVRRWLEGAPLDGP